MDLSDWVTLGQKQIFWIVSKRRKEGKISCLDSTHFCSPAQAVDTDDDYVVSLLSRQLGMTIENVLERTVVRSVHPNSEAFRLNVKTNSVILNIGSARFPGYFHNFSHMPSTLYQTHLETLESLKNTVRPVKLRLCKLDESVLTTFRTEMHSLVSRSKSQVFYLKIIFV